MHSAELQLLMAGFGGVDPAAVLLGGADQLVGAVVGQARGLGGKVRRKRASPGTAQSFSGSAEAQWLSAMAR